MLVYNWHIGVPDTPKWRYVMAVHAKLSPSSAKRWMNCAGSVAKIGDEPSTAGMPAMMGTAAPKVVEFMLQENKLDASEFHGNIVHVKKDGDEESLILASDDTKAMSEKPGWFAFPVNDEMVYGVQTMIDEVERVKAEMIEPVLYTERFLDGSWLDSRLGGTADVTIVEEIPEWIHLFDYKNGRVIVEVTDEQMKNYAVFLLHEHPGALGVVVHLIQPNAQHEEGIIRSVTYTADELKMFELQMKDAADATSAPNALLRAGDWCMYCPAKTYCEAFAALAKDEAYADFAEDPPDDGLPVPMLTDDMGQKQVGEAYSDGDEYRAALERKARWVPVLDQWAKEIHARIQVQLLEGKTVGDWKLVRGKSNRVLSPDEVTIQKVLNDKWGIPDEYLFNAPKMKSPAQLEKTAIPGKTKKAIKDIVASVSKKPLGKIVIARGTDAREAIDPGLVGADEFAADPADDFEP
jgi:hypothetical protein